MDIPQNASPDTGAAAESAMPGLLIQEWHIETLGGEYADTKEISPEGYVSIPKLLGMNRTDAETALKTAGVEYTVEVKRNPADADVVYAVEYAGFSDGELHYINPVQPVHLCVSADKPVFPEATVQNTVYITFDDGPTEEGTKEILDILDCYGIKGTFFQVGDYVEKYPASAKAVYDRGHDIACHSMTHQYEHIYASAENLMAEVDEWVALMERIGVDFDTVPLLFRYPGGSKSQYFSESQLAVMNEMLFERGFCVYDWNIVSNDALLFQCPEGVTAYDYIKNTFRETYEAKKDSSSPKILLLHETVAETRVVLPWIIEYLIEEGCTFAPLSTMPGGWTFDSENQ